MLRLLLGVILIILNTLISKKWKLIQSIKYNFIAGNLTIFQVLFTLPYDKKFIGIDFITIASKRYVGFKILYIIAAYAFWAFLCHLYKTRKEEQTKIFIGATLFYLVIMGINIFITWPGNWRWDEIDMLNLARGLEMCYWQHYLSSVQYIISAMFIPYAGGIVIMQNVIISFIVGYAVKEMVVFFKGSKLPYLTLLVLLLPTVVWHNLYPLRLTLNAYLEVLFLILTLKFIFGKIEFKHWNALGYISLSAVIAIWRTEAFYYMLMVPVFICIINYRKVQKIITKRNILQSGLMILFCMILYLPQSHGISQMEASAKYNVTGYIYTLDYFYFNLEDWDTNPNAQKIEEVINTDTFNYYEAPAKAYWDSNFFKPDVTDAQIETVTSNFYSLMLKHPILVLEARFQLFFETVFSNRIIMDAESINGSYYQDLLLRYPASISVVDQWSPNFRETYMLAMLGEGLFSEIVLPTWNAFIPIMACVLYFILFLLNIKKMWKQFLVICVPCIRIGLMFLTAPTYTFMYYFPPLVLGLILIILTITAIKTGKWREYVPHFFISRK